MKRFPTWRYKCDFCGKNNHSASAMSTHEKHCTMNPARICRVHKHAVGGSGEQAAVSSMLEVLRAHWYDEDHGVSALRHAAHDCPACMLAAIRQSGASKGCADEDGYSAPHIGTEQFDFKKEMADLWSSVNQDVEEYPL